MIDEFNYPRYTNQVYSYSRHPKDWEIPFLFEHVFDLNLKKYVKNSNNCCYYSPVKDVSSFNVESSDSSIVAVEGDNLYGVDRGNCYIYFEDENHKKFKIKVVVYKGEFNFKLSKNILYLYKGNIINLNTVLNHINCKHYNECLFEANKLLVKDKDLVWEINNIQNQIKSYENIIECYINGEVIYHKDLDEYYNISIQETYNSNGLKHYNTSVTVKKGFIKHVKSEIKKLRIELRGLVRQLS